MSSKLRNILAVVAGILAGMIINSGIIWIGGILVPPPEGVDTSSAEALREGIHLFGPLNFLVPFLAHAVGTFAGAFLASLISATGKMRAAMIVGFVFLAGGITASILIPAPAWFIILDLLIAYLPMAYLAGWLVIKMKRAE
ncbi:MAG: hypothetical protein LAT84_14560 [Balneolia bacterium]|nr:hypothetical protein [Balneolia bacterium]